MLPRKFGRDKIQQVPVLTCRWEGQNIPHSILRTAKLLDAYQTHACYASEISIVEGPTGEKKRIGRLAIFSSVAEGKMIRPRLRVVMGVL